jgi:pyridoxine 5-phosphate synthase
MTKLSVNINKIATIRNARGGLVPNVVDAAIKCQCFGADGITIHPRPDERHITKEDVYRIKDVMFKEYNIEGFPSVDFIQMILEIKPDQVTLVPDKPDVLTSCKGWDTIRHQIFLKEIITKFNNSNIRTSIFVDPILDMIIGAKKCGADRIELYTEDFATNYDINKENAIRSYILAANKATEIGLGINAGHDLNLQNLRFFSQKISYLEEVSIGHAIISDALYLGLENTIQMYKRLIS